MQATVPEPIALIYEIKGEEMVRSQRLFDELSVSLIIDNLSKIIWIWSGKKSKLFHRYIATNWVGNMKPKKKYVNYKQEMIKQGLEPDTFRMLIKRIISDNPAISVPQAILAGLQDENRRDLIATRKKDDLKENRGDLPKNDIDSKAVNQILNEIREYQARIKDLCDQVDKGVLALESLVNNKDTGEGNDSKRG